MNFKQIFPLESGGHSSPYTTYLLFIIAVDYYFIPIVKTMLVKDKITSLPRSSFPSHPL